MKARCCGGTGRSLVKSLPVDLAYLPRLLVSTSRPIAQMLVEEKVLDKATFCSYLVENTNTLSSRLFINEISF